MVKNVLQTLWRNARAFSGLEPGHSFLWPRWLMLRAAGAVFVVIFAGILHEGSALIGPEGLLPAGRLMEVARADYPGAVEAFFRTPSLFWVSSKIGRAHV